MTAPKSSETTLKPCPFCGGEARLSGNMTRSDNWVVCRRCGVHYPADTRLEFTEAEAVEAWNTRAEMSYEDIAILLDELGLSERTCRVEREKAASPIDGKTIILHRCSECHELMRPTMRYCPNCGAKVVEK